jgi:hypothetical protein
VNLEVNDIFRSLEKFKRFMKNWHCSSEARIGAGWAQAHPKISKTSYISANS